MSARSGGRATPCASVSRRAMTVAALLLASQPTSVSADDAPTRVLRLGGQGEAAALEAELALLELQLVDATGDVSPDRDGVLRLLLAGSAAVLLVQPSPPRLYVMRCGRVEERILPGDRGSTSALLTAELVVATLQAPCALPRLSYEGGGALTAPVAYGLTLSGEDFERPFEDGALGEAALGEAAPGQRTFRETRRAEAAELGAPPRVPGAARPWRFGVALGPAYDVLGRRAHAQVELTATHQVVRAGARSLSAGLRAALPLSSLQGGDERTTATVHVGSLDLTLEGRLPAERWTLVADAGPALLWARMRVDDTPGPLQPAYPLLGARAVFGGLSAGVGIERWITPHVGLRFGLRLRHALPGGVTLRRAPQEDDASPQFFRFGTQLGLSLGLSLR